MTLPDQRAEDGSRSAVAPFASPARIALIAAAALLGAMAVFFILHDSYRDVGGDLLGGSGTFEQAPAGGNGTKPDRSWRAEGNAISWEPGSGVDGAGAMRLGVDNKHGSRLDYTLDNPRRFQFLRLSGRLRTEGIVAGEAPWNTARLLLLFNDRSGRRIETDHREVCAMTGTQRWRDCEHVFPVPDAAVTAHVHVQNLAASGTLWVDNLRLTPAVEKPSTFGWNALFATLWCGVLAYCVWSARLPRRVFGMAMLTLGVLIIVAAVVPRSTIEETVDLGADTVRGLAHDLRPHLADDRSQQSGTSSGSATSTRPGAVQPAHLPYMTVNKLKKVGHFVLFALLAFLAFFSAIRHRGTASHASRPVATFATVGVALLLFAVAVEVLQFLSATRGPSLLDWAIDAAGVALGATIAWVTHRVARDSVRTGPAA